MRIIRLLMALAIIFLLVVLGFSKKNWDEKIEQHAQQTTELVQNEVAGVPVEKVEETKADAKNVEKIEEKPDKTAEAAKPVEKDKGEFYNLLLEQKISSIKLLGDGITAGYGHSEYSAPDEGRIIFSNNRETFREAGTEFDSWANHLRNYIKKSEFNKVDVINAGIRDKTADWTLRNIEGLLNTNEEAVIVTIGTDDRIFSTLKDYEATMRDLLAVADERSEFLVVMSPPPSKEDLQPYAFSMKEIDEVLKKISEEKGYLFISHFDAFQEQFAEGAPYKSLMQTSGANPVDKGYDLMWKTMQEELDLE